MTLQPGTDYVTLQSARPTVCRLGCQHADSKLARAREVFKIVPPFYVSRLELIRNCIALCDLGIEYRHWPV